MASVHKDTESMLQPYIKALSTYGRKMAAARGSEGPSLRPQGVILRTKQPNVQTPSSRRPSGRPPAEHIVKLLVKNMTSGVAGGIQYKPSEGIIHPPKAPTIHPGKALALKNVKAIHLGSHTVKKVAL